MANETRGANETVGHNLPESGINIGWDPAATSPAGAICSLHYHEELEFMLVVEGKLSLFVDSEEYTAESGQVLYVGSRVPHYTVSQTDGLRYILLQVRTDILGIDVGGGVIPSIISGDTVAAALIDDPAIADKIRAAADEHSGALCGYEYMIHASVSALIGLMIRGGYIKDPDRDRDSAGLERLAPVFDYVNENYQSKLSIEELSEYMKLNPSYFCRLFKAATGVTFTEYLNAVRVQKSERMLRKSTKSITEISNEVGFATVTYYNRIFKKYMKCTPSVYRMLRYRNI